MIYTDAGEVLDSE